MHSNDADGHCNQQCLFRWKATDLDAAENLSFDELRILIGNISKNGRKAEKNRKNCLVYTAKKSKFAKCLNLLGEKMDSAKHREIPKNDLNKAHKDIAVEFLSLVGLGRPKEGLRFFAPECKTHNPYIVGGMDALIDAMVAVQKEGAEGILQGSKADFGLVIRHVLADADLVAVHTQLSSSRPSDGGLRQVHLFRFSGEKIVEYWDITQQVPENAPNAAGTFS